MGRRVVAPAVLLLLALVGLSWTTSAALEELSGRWFERDTELRGQLAVRGAQETLAEAWSGGDVRRLEATLGALSRDERILAAAACTADGRRLAATPAFPRRFTCADLLRRLRTPGGDRWNEVVALASGRVHVAAIPLVAEGTSPGFVVLVHDMSYADRRQAAARGIVLTTLLLLSLAASATTFLVGRLAWRRWSVQMQRLLQGEPTDPEFDQLAREIRDVFARLGDESVGGPGNRAWTPPRLRKALREELQDDEVVIVANREPFMHVRGDDGTIRLLRPASGLVTALEPVMRACSGVWVAHGSGSADRETADRRGRLKVPPEDPSYTLRRVWLSPEEEQGYYYGFANEGLWPLCHIADVRPTFRSTDFAQYRIANQRFADAVAEEVDADDPIVMVQDYHFALLPRMLRERMPRAVIITFWHIPWPNSERLSVCPWTVDLVEGMLGSSILGFHTQFHCNNFLDAVDHYLEARIDREQNGVVQGGRMTHVRPYPISIAWPSPEVERAAPVEACRREIRAELGLPADLLLGVGVDRLDYTKGIEERLLAVERLLERHPELRGRFTFVQVAAPSRTKIEAYQALDDAVERLVAQINTKLGRGSWQPVVLLARHVEPADVVRFYRAADLCYVSSLHDGMNLVAKEFVAARDDGQGVLVLSRFTGAARELTTALLVNPYDIDEAADALYSALHLSKAEQRARMEALRLVVSEHNVYRWAGHMLMDAARLRRQERLSDRLAGEPVLVVES